MWERIFAQLLQNHGGTDIAEAAKPELTIDLVVHADLEATMQSLINAAGDVVQSTEDSWTSWAERCRTVVEDYFPASTDYQRPKELLNPYHAIFDVFDNLRESDVVIAGNGVSVVGVFQVAQLNSVKGCSKHRVCIWAMIFSISRCIDSGREWTASNLLYW